MTGWLQNHAADVVGIVEAAASFTALWLGTRITRVTADRARARERGTR